MKKDVSFKVIKIDSTPNPQIGEMGRKITERGWDSRESQFKQAIIPYEIDSRKKGFDFLDMAPNLVIASVRARLQDWQAYAEGRTSSTPGKAYFPEHKAADAIWSMVKPLPSINTPDPKPNLDVSADSVLRAYEIARKGEKYIFLG